MRPAALWSMGGGWGLGPLAETAEALAEQGVVVRSSPATTSSWPLVLDQVARRQPRVLPFRFTDQIPTLMAAADLVLTTPGATTCSEARVVNRPLLLLDVMPGHGRDNMQHELELGAGRRLRRRSRTPGPMRARCPGAVGAARDRPARGRSLRRGIRQRPGHGRHRPERAPTHAVPDRGDSATPSPPTEEVV